MLAVDTAAGTFGADSAATLEALGLPFEPLDTDALRTRWPQFRVPAHATTLHTDQAAFLRAGEAVGALGAWLVAQGVQVRQHVQVTAVDPDAGHVVLADGSTLEVDAVLDVAGSALVDLERYRLLEARTCYYTWHEAERFVVRPHGDRGVVCAGHGDVRQRGEALVRVGDSGP